MKRIIAFLLAVVMLVGMMALVGCDKDNENPGSGNNPNTDNNQNNVTDVYALVTAAMKKTMDAKSYIGAIKQTVTENLMGNTSTVKADYTLKASLGDPAKPLMGLDGEIEMEGEKMPYTYYFDGAWMYYVMYGEGFKAQATMEEFKEDAGGIDSLFTDLPKAIFDGVTAKTEGNTTKVELTADSETIKAMYTELITDMFYDVVGDIITPVVVSDVKIVVSVADGYVMGYDLSFKSSYTIGSDSVSYDYSQSVVFESIDKAVTITPPDGYENFMEMGWG